MPSVRVEQDARPPRSTLGRLREWLPRGHTLPDDAWVRRHRWLLALLWLHVPALVGFGMLEGYGAAHSLREVAATAICAVVATLAGRRRRLAAGFVAAGLLTASVVAVHLSGGYVEAHFHFFVVVTVLVLYEDWPPLALAVAYVLLHHGVFGVLDPGAVYNHAEGTENPWRWAAIHAAFVAALGFATVLNWRLNEDARAATRSAYADAAQALSLARESEQRFRSAFEDAPIGMALLDPRRERFGRFLRVNRALCELLGYSESELLARDFQSITHPDDRDANLADAHAFADGALDVYEVEKRYLHADGRAISVQVHGTLLHDDEGRPSLCVSQILDVTERRRFEAALAHRALHDELTGLANRSLFLDRLRHALAQLERRAGAVAVLFLDLDNFKLVNDTYGHAVGDEVLRVVARRLAGAVRRADTVARFGGDEFALLCEDPGDAAAAAELAERLGDAISEPIEADGRSVILTGSIGIVVERDPRRDPENVLRDADAAMYRAKGTRPGGYEVFRAELRARIVRRVETEHALRRAIVAREVALHYQPIVDLGSGRVEFVEALARWGDVPPSEFIPIAEETGLILPLGDQLLRAACAEAVRWPGARPPKVAVNISPRQLVAPDFVASVTRALATAGLPPERLSLEITESAALDESERAREALVELNELGVCAALDDFGSGYSSLGRLRGLPPLDVLKIDRSFVAGVERDPHARALVTALAGMVRSLGLRAIAEGLETAEQARAVRELDCDLGQGYHFARPQPAEEIRRLLAAEGAAAEPVA